MSYLEQSICSEVNSILIQKRPDKRQTAHESKYMGDMKHQLEQDTAQKSVDNIVLETQV